MTHPVPTRRSSDLICNGDRYVREGKWLQQRMPLTRAIRGRRLGILGLGRIGREIARKAAVFDMEIAYHGRSKQDVPYRFYADLVEMARDSNYISSEERREGKEGVSTCRSWWLPVHKK